LSATQDPPQRLLSPTKRRIWNPYTPNKVGGADLREKAAMTYACLRKAGWTDYAGPGLVDSRGYVIPESDPSIKPEPPAVGRAH